MFMRAFIVHKFKRIIIRMIYNLFTDAYRSQTPHIHAEADLHLVQSLVPAARSYVCIRSMLLSKLTGETTMVGPRI